MLLMPTSHHCELVLSPGELAIELTGVSLKGPSGGFTLVTASSAWTNSLLYLDLNLPNRTWGAPEQDWYMSKLGSQFGLVLRKIIRSYEGCQQIERRDARVGWTMTTFAVAYK